MYAWLKTYSARWAFPQLAVMGLTATFQWNKNQFDIYTIYE